ncbi:hypothetical protein B0H10DRAFT_1213968 [Mycena sp. CBHHK59/15]|nr:hypothetical protein B0H10DRAFT_1213968 [Mycena sp. CBHHK59/15]
MSDFTLVDPRGWEYDLHSVYSAYIGYFQLHNVPWYDRSWGHLFSTFEEFLAFSWPVITVTDSWTGRAHIVTRLTSIGAFLRMIKTRFGETLPQAPNILHVSPFESSTRHLRTVSDYASYKKLHSTLPAAVLSALKLRVRAGERTAVRDLWDARASTFLAVDFEWSERNEKSCLEWGYAAVRCGHLEALGHWPPVPDANYRKGHYIVSEYVDKVANKHCPTHPWQYAFGESQVVSKTKLPQIIQAVISSFASPDSETIPNTLVLVGHGIHGDLARMEEMKIKLPHNMLILDTATFERTLFAAGHRPPMPDPHAPTKPRASGATLSLEHLLRSLPSPSPSASPLPPSTQLPIPVPPTAQGALVPGAPLHNAGNDAFLTLYALQLLLAPDTPAPAVAPKKRPVSVGVALTGSQSLRFSGAVPTPRPASFVMGGPVNASFALNTSGSYLSPSGLVGNFANMHMHPWQGSHSAVPGHSSKHLSANGNGNGPANGNGNVNAYATILRSSRRLSAVPSGDGSSARRG